MPLCRHDYWMVFMGLSIEEYWQDADNFEDDEE
jgi:hypothetical protein